jgi:FAD/FMN-containing dehydrogenase
MTTQPTISPDVPTAALLSRLSSPGEPGYVEATNVWNGAIQRRPALVARCTSVGDVSAAVLLAQQRGLELSVRGGGHNFAGHAVCEGGLMIDLSPLRGVQVDAALRRARCGGGAPWSELDAATQAHGLAVTGGMISHTGVGGLTLGGGVGWLHNKLGLSCESLIAAEVVLADGRIVRASEREHADLFWALRGGGGNFGVVTEFEFALAPVGPLVHLGMLFYGLQEAPAMFRYSDGFVRDLDDDCGLFLAGMSAPPAPFVPAQWQGQPCFAFALAGFGSEEAHARQLEGLRRAASPSFEMVTQLPYTELQKMFDVSAPWGTKAYEKAVYLRELNDRAIAVLVDQLPRRAAATSFMPMLCLGGKFRRNDEAAVAFGGRRDSRFLINISALTQTQADYEADTRWARETWAQLVPHAEDIGGYVNFQMEVDDARLQASYGAVKYQRLRAIKREYDPKNVFHLNANIRPL